jgi:hypothetical protein
VLKGQKDRITVAIHQIPLGLTNCYLIRDEGTVLVDGGQPKNIRKFLKNPNTGSPENTGTQMGIETGCFQMKIKKLNLLSDTKIIRRTRLKLDMNPYLDNEYFVLRKIKQRAKKLTGTVNKVWDKTTKIRKPKTETMTNNCCPI